MANFFSKLSKISPTVLPFDLWGHVLGLLSPARSQLLRFRLISRYFDEAIVQLYVRELRDDILTDMDLVKLPDFTNLVRTWRHPQLIVDLTLGHFRRDWYSATKLRAALKTFTNLQRLTVLGDAFDSECLDQVIRHSSTTLESLCFEYHSKLSIPPAAVNRLRSLRALSVRREPPPQQNQQLLHAMFPGGTSMLNLSNSSATGSPVRTIDSDVAAFLVQSMKTFVQNVQTKQATVALLNYLQENETPLRSLHFTGFVDWDDVGRILHCNSQLRELRLQSTDETTAYFKVSTSTNDGPPYLVIRHDRLAHLSVGSLSRPLDTIEFHCPSLRTVEFSLPFKAHHLNLTNCPLLERLQLGKSSDPSPSGIDNLKISVGKLSLPRYGKFFKELLMSNTQVDTTVNVIQQYLEVMKYDNGSKMNNEEYGLIWMDAPVLKTFHCDLSKTNTLNWISVNGFPALEELNLIDVYLGDRTTQDPAQAEELPMKILTRKELPLYLLHALSSKFPRLLKLSVVFSPINLYLTSIDHLSHQAIRELHVACERLDSIDMPNMQKFSCSYYLSTPPKCLSSVFDTKVFPNLRDVRISGWGGAGTNVIRSALLHHLELDVVEIPLIKCRNLVTIKLSARAQVNGSAFIKLLNNLPAARNIELQCPVESLNDPIIIRHSQLRRFSVDKLCGEFSFVLPLLEFLCLTNTDMLNITNFDLPETQFVTLGSPKFKQRFATGCPRIEKVTVLRDATRQTRSAGRQAKSKTM